jgi:hypothetical protein
MGLRLTDFSVVVFNFVKGALNHGLEESLGAVAFPVATNEVLSVGSSFNQCL